MSFNVANLEDTTLANWGKVSDLGALPLDGDPNIAGAVVFGAPDAAVCCAYFSCNRGSFEMVYPFHEHATVLEGEVTLTLLDTEEKKTFAKGDTWFFEKGTRVKWEITSDRFVKHYLSINS